jgi:pilus assembly protein Flp/PilA
MDARKWFVRLRKDDDGATLIEYSILIGLLTVAVIALVLAVGGWVSSKWNSLNAALT